MALAEDLPIEQTPPLEIPARALLVGTPVELRLDLLRELDQMGIEAHVADESLYRTLQTLGADERFAMMIVHKERLGTDGYDFLRKVSFSHPGMRQVLIEHSPSSWSPDDALASPRTRKLCGANTSAGEIAESANRALCHHHYDQTLVGVMQRALPSFVGGDKLAAHEAFLRASASMMAPITAMTEIAGEGLWGRLLLSTHESIAAAYAASVLGREPATRDELWDALGELANLFASEIRRYYDSQGLESTQSPPTILEGQSVLVRQASSPLSVVVPFKHSAFAEPIYAEWVLSHKSPNRPATKLDDEARRASGGESITFL